MTSTIRLEYFGAEARLTLSSPDTGNQLTLPDIESAIAAIGDAARRPEVRVLRLRAEGKSFCAGANFVPPSGEQRGFGGGRQTAHISKREMNEDPDEGERRNQNIAASPQAGDDLRGVIRRQTTVARCLEDCRSHVAVGGLRRRVTKSAPGGGHPAMKGIASRMPPT